MSAGGSILQCQPRTGILDLSWGHPAPTTLPVRAWARATESALTVYGWRLLTYGPAAGPGPLIEWLAERASGEGERRCPEAEVFVTAGASHALELVTGQLTRRGDVVLVDSPTYHLAPPVFADHGALAVAAPADDEGIDPDATADLVRSARRAGQTVGVLYLVPTFCNPTGRSLPLERRLALLAMARRLKLTIVEDDTYRELAYDEPAPASLWSLADAGEVVRIGSFAKSVAPGLRLGWINAPAGLVHALTDRAYVRSGGGVNHGMAMIMAWFGTSGAYDEHLSGVREEYAARRDTLVDGLRRALPGMDVPTCAGGWYLWLSLPLAQPAGTALRVAEDCGVSYLEGSRFFVDGRHDDHVRLSFSFLDRADLVEAARRLGLAVHRMGDGRETGPR